MGPSRVFGERWPDNLRNRPGNIVVIVVREEQKVASCGFYARVSLGAATKAPGDLKIVDSGVWVGSKAPGEHLPAVANDDNLVIRPGFRLQVGYQGC